MRIERLEIDDLRSIKRLRWPEDGLGWGGRIPDVVVVAGANGSGKTTLLNELAWTLQELQKNAKAWSNHQEKNRDYYKDDQHLKINLNLNLNFNSEQISLQKNVNLHSLIDLSKHILDVKICYFRSNRSSSGFKKLSALTTSKIKEPNETYYEWFSDKSNDISLSEIFYSARWEDANAVLNGRPELVQKFKFYADEFERFTEGEKRLVWTDEGELLVETRDGARHDVNEMSSGEHQALIFSIMLSRWWAPGSIILIDEPELHLHTHWQAKLLQRIIDLQKERGGQAILATQSSDLFSMAPAGSQVLLGGW